MTEVRLALEQLVSARHWDLVMRALLFIPLSMLISCSIAVHHRSHVELLSACASVGFLSVRGSALVDRAIGDSRIALTYLIV